MKRFPNVGVAISYASGAIQDTCGDCQLCVPVPVVYRANVPEDDGSPHLREGIRHLLQAGIVRVVGEVASEKFKTIIQARERQDRLRPGDYNRIEIIDEPIEPGRIII